MSLLIHRAVHHDIDLLPAVDFTKTPLNFITAMGFSLLNVLSTLHLKDIGLAIEVARVCMLFAFAITLTFSLQAVINSKKNIKRIEMYGSNPVGIRLRYDSNIIEHSAIGNELATLDKSIDELTHYSDTCPFQ